MPPISCTSKWRMPIVRLAGLADEREDSGRSSSSDLAVLRRARASTSMRSRSSSSVSSSSSGSNALMRATRFSYCELLRLADAAARVQDAHAV